MRAPAEGDRADRAVSTRALLRPHVHADRRSWLLYRFTGGVDGGLFLTDCVNASRTMLMDLRKLEWSDECLDFFGFDKRILATIVSNAEVYGELKICRDDAVPTADGCRPTAGSRASRLPA